MRDHSIGATFIPINTEMAKIPVFTGGYDNDSGSGYIWPTGDIQIPAGSSITFTIIPDTDSRIADIRIDGRSTGPATEYTITTGGPIPLQIEALFVEKDKLLAIAKKKCINENGETIECVPGENATIYADGQVICSSNDCEMIVVPFSRYAPIILKAVPDPGTSEITITIEGWEIGNELYEGDVYWTKDDLFGRPVIACSGHN